MRVQTLPAVATAVLAIALGFSTASAQRGLEVKMRSRTFVPGAATSAAREYLQALPADRGHLLLQLVTPGDREQRAALEGAGVRFLQYIPDNTWIVSAPQDLFLSGAPAVRWAEPLRREDRLHPQLWDEEPRSWARTADGRWRLYVRFFADTDMVDLRAALLALGAGIVEELPAFRAFEITGSAAIVEALAADDRVYWIRETTPPPQYANDSNRANVHADAVQEPPYGLSGAGVTVAIWDGGLVDNGHPDFGARLTLADAGNTDWHATHVAGTVGGNGVNSSTQGGTSLQWRGMAPQCGLVSYDWNSPLTEHNSAINTYGASVSQNSWSYSVSGDLGNCSAYGDYDSNAAEYDEIIGGLYGGPMVIDFSAGNERDDGDCGMSGPPYNNYGVIPTPATAKNMITVGAINSNSDVMTTFSSWGPTDDGRIKPELAGPGCQSNDDGGVTSTTPGGGYGVACGTSMSCPTVSGCVALLQEAHLAGHGQLAPSSLVKALLLNTARDLGNVGPDYSFGFGAVDIQAAVDQLQAGAFAEDVIDEGEERLVPFEVLPGTSRIQVTLAWTDPPASPGASVTLVNDLDLVLVGPDQTDYLPWDLFPTIPAAAATRRENHRDPVEQVTVDDPVAGVWTARVRESGVPQGPQAFSLAGTTPEQTCLGTTIDVPAEFATIQAAIDAAGYCDTIRVAPGSYAEQLDVTQRVAIIAPGGPEVTIIQPPIGFRALTIERDALIEGFTIVQGMALGSFPGGYGGGIYSNGASPTIRNCVFQDCIAQGAGGGVFSLGGGITIESCVFHDNSAQQGGAIAIESGFLASVIGNVMHHNHASSAGGGIAISSGPALVRSNTIADNTATSAAGGIRIIGSAVTLDRNIVAGNTAPSASGISCAGIVTQFCNDIWNNDASTCGTGTDTFSADPGFCDPSSGDYRITLDSPCAPGNTPGACDLVGALPAVESCGVIDVGGPAEPVTPTQFAVHPARPNPFTRSTRIGVDLASRDEVRLEIFDVSGRRLRTVVAAELAAGRYSFEWDGRDASGRAAPAGVYFYELRAGVERVTRKLVILP